MNVEIPAKMAPLFKPARFKVGVGGRGGVKSWSFARALLILGRKCRLRIACGRETMQSIKDSVHQLLKDQIELMELAYFYRALQTEIKGLNGTQFTFHGLRDQSIHNIKSLEGADILWVEEAQNVSKKSWTTVIPTVRKPGSEIWVSFNPELESDDTYQRWVVHPPPGTVLIPTSFRDNPFLSKEMKDDIDHMKATDPDGYNNVYEGQCKQIVEGAIYKEQIVAAQKEGRFCRVPYDAARPVDIFWDLGFGDNVSIWFAQSIGFEFRLVDFVSDHLKDLSFYFKELASRPYAYRTCWLPHDARAKTLAAGGRSIEQQVSAAGYKVKIVPGLSIDDGIAAARSIFNRCWFDNDNCADGLQALKHYRYEFDEALGTFRKDPLHDWASHPADAFRYFAVAIKEPQRQKEKDEEKTLTRGMQQSWMS
jgi:phage terminase large subunit